jgi:hypothetical protein
VFRFIIEYSSLRDFGPLGNNRSIFIWGFLKDEILLVLKFEISYRVMMSWRILVPLEDFSSRLYFCMVKYLNFHFFFCIKILFNVNGKATVWHTPCLVFVEGVSTSVKFTPW